MLQSLLITEGLVMILFYLVLTSCNISILGVFVKFSNWYPGGTQRSNQDPISPIKIHCCHTSSAIFENTNIQNKQHWILNKIIKLALTVKKVLNSIKEGAEVFIKTQGSTRTWEEFKCKLSYTLVIHLNILKGICIKLGNLLG